MTQERELKDLGWQTVHGCVPSKSNSYRIITLGGRHSLGKTPTLYRYEKSFYLQAGKYHGANIAGLFALEARFYFPTLSHDLDNAFKVLLDCLQYTKTIVNDNRCVDISAKKFIDKADPRVEFRIVEVTV